MRRRGIGGHRGGKDSVGGGARAEVEERHTVSEHLEHRENCDRLHHAGEVSPPYHLGSITGLDAHAPDVATMLPTRLAAPHSVFLRLLTNRCPWTAV